MRSTCLICKASTIEQGLSSPFNISSSALFANSAPSSPEASIIMSWSNRKPAVSFEGMEFEMSRSYHDRNLTDLP